MRQTLIDMLTYKRPAGSKSEKAFREKYITPLGDGHQFADPYGNIHITVPGGSGGSRGSSRVMWSCHTDTVHRSGGRQAIQVSTKGIVTLVPRPIVQVPKELTIAPPIGIRQTRAQRKADRRMRKQWAKLFGVSGGSNVPGAPQVTTKPVPVYSAYLDDPDASNCLGADDTVGVYILTEMIKAKVPGHYVFHHAEEKGGVGSRASAAYYAQYWRENFDYAIALDRAGKADIITHQAGVRCASSTFALELAEAMRGVCAESLYTPSSHGVYTDTAEYVELIPECTNLSVGYANQHTTEEYADLDHAELLLGMLCDLDVAKLGVHRDPTKVEYDVPMYDHHDHITGGRYVDDYAYGYDDRDAALTAREILERDYPDRIDIGDSRDRDFRTALAEWDRWCNTRDVPPDTTTTPPRATPNTTPTPGRKRIKAQSARQDRKGGYAGRRYEGWTGKWEG